MSIQVFYKSIETIILFRILFHLELEFLYSNNILQKQCSKRPKVICQKSKIHSNTDYFVSPRLYSS